MPNGVSYPSMAMPPASGGTPPLPGGFTPQGPGGFTLPPSGFPPQGPGGYTPPQIGPLGGGTGPTDIASLVAAVYMLAAVVHATAAVFNYLIIVNVGFGIAVASVTYTYYTDQYA